MLIPELLQLESELTDGEGGTVFVDTFQLAVTDDLGIRIVHLQRPEQVEHRGLLGRSTRIGGSASLVETALVADANGMGIVVAGMGPDHLLGPAEVQLSVTGDVVVVAAALPATGLVHLVEHSQRQVLVGTARRAMDDNQVNFSHRSLGIRGSCSSESGLYPGSW